jgi:hypothetical protein
MRKRSRHPANDSIWPFLTLFLVAITAGVLVIVLN